MSEQFNITPAGASNFYESIAAGAVDLGIANSG